MTVHVYISGNIQGIGFRQFVKYRANRLNIKGWVKNLSASHRSDRQGGPDGRVEAVLQGRIQDVDRMVLLCRKGPFLAEVRGLKVEEMPDQEFDTFEIAR